MAQMRQGILYSSVVFVCMCFMTACIDDNTNYAPVSRLGIGPEKTPDMYVVKRGDNLYSVAWQFGIDDRAIIKMNHLNPPYDLMVGQRLLLKPLISKAEPLSLPVVTTTVMHEQWMWPVRGRLIRGFVPGLTGNAGIDIAGYVNEPIMASQSGVVVYSGDGIRGYGNLIIIKQGSDYLSAYAFNQKNLVRVGDSVKQGQNIAIMGRDNQQVAALHFEIRQDGKPMNPLSYLH